MNSKWLKIETSFSIHGDVIMPAVHVRYKMGAAGPLILALTLWMLVVANHYSCSGYWNL